MAPASTYTFTKRMMLTADGRAVPAGHPEGVVLLGTPGKTIPHSRAVELGLVGDTTGEYPKHAGGGYYELSDGSRVKGKADAAAAEKALHGPTEDKAHSGTADK